MIFFPIINHLLELISDLKRERKMRSPAQPAQTDLGVDRVPRGPGLCRAQTWVAGGGKVDPHLTDVAGDQFLLLCEVT